MEKIKIATGLYYMDIPEIDMRILCGCPADSVKHLKKKGLILTKEKAGVSYETGPNAILLSDLTIQNGGFSNLAEFPVLHMFYKQGVIIPGHPNNTGKKPLLIGTRSQLTSQGRYIFRGNYGLADVDEIMAAGVERAEAEEMMRMKLKFAYGHIRKTEELLDYLVVEGDAVDIGGGVMLSHTGLNLYSFHYGGETCEVDLNLGQNETYELPYSLGYYQVKPEYFSIVHSGEGDGWDPNRPCMSSILTFQGRIYLIDAGPAILGSLTALGISVNEIEGIFHTHCHDDHFAGLTSLMLADHRINHYAAPLVRASIIRKFSALMSLNEEKFSDYFNICDLEIGKWNRVDGLEVLPVFSAHPVETTFMYFRTPWAGGYKTYGHLADIISLDVLEGMAGGDGLSRKWIDRFREALFSPVDVKKIDAGKGSIHGNTADFASDKSGKIIMSHSAESFTLKEKEIGSTTAFGQIDVLIPSRQDFSMKTAANLLRSYFPDVEMEFIRLFLDCPKEDFSPGSIILRKGIPCQYIYLLLSGVVEAVDADLGISHMLSQGFLIGDVPFLSEDKPSFTCRALSPVSVLSISSILFAAFTQELKIVEKLKQTYTKRLFLHRTGLFGEMLSFLIHDRIARLMERESYPAGTDLAKLAGEDILILEAGSAQLKAGDVCLGSLGPREDFLGAEGVLFGMSAFYTAVTEGETSCYRIKGAGLLEIPIIQLKLLENFKKHIGVFALRCCPRWEKRYETGDKRKDGLRRGIFGHLESVVSTLHGGGDRKLLARDWEALDKDFRAYVKSLRRGKGCRDLERILEKLDFWRDRIPGEGQELDSGFLEYLAARIAAYLINGE
ncbi:MAG: cyclic nucleotide-binding domain-containing protein [Spirochaetia bacterium]|jgi:hemerythrin|nr:cyclic nucleotide-binding domain-containing protein [Spirochaetia bacterium]